MSKVKQHDVDRLIALVGGSANIATVTHCITRLRLSVHDMSLVDDATLKANRAIGVVHLNDHNLQVVIGPQVQSVKDELDYLIREANNQATASEPATA